MQSVQRDSRETNTFTKGQLTHNSPTLLQRHEGEDEAAFCFHGHGSDVSMGECIITSNRSMDEVDHRRCVRTHTHTHAHTHTHTRAHTQL